MKHYLRVNNEIDDANINILIPIHIIFKLKRSATSLD